MERIAVKDVGLQIKPRGANSDGLIFNSRLRLTKHLFELWRQVRDGTLTRAAFLIKIGPFKQQVSELLIKGTNLINSKTGNTCRNILKLEYSLWTFTRVVGVEPTSNQAERALRRAVMWRRKSFGTQSETGSRFVERILTVMTTLRQQSRSVLGFLTSLLEIRNSRAGCRSTVTAA